MEGFRKAYQNYMLTTVSLDKLEGQSRNQSASFSKSYARSTNHTNQTNRQSTRASRGDTAKSFRATTTTDQKHPNRYRTMSSNTTSRKKKKYFLDYDLYLPYAP